MGLDTAVFPASTGLSSSCSLFTSCTVIARERSMPGRQCGVTNSSTADMSVRGYLPHTCYNVRSANGHTVRFSHPSLSVADLHPACDRPYSAISVTTTSHSTGFQSTLLPVFLGMLLVAVVLVPVAHRPHTPSLSRRSPAWSPTEPLRTAHGGRPGLSAAFPILTFSAFRSISERFTLSAA